MPTKAHELRESPVEKIGYSIEEAAGALGVGRTVMCGLIKRGTVESVKIGRRRVVPIAALHAYMRGLIEEQRDVPTPAA